MSFHVERADVNILAYPNKNKESVWNFSNHDPTDTDDYLSIWCDKSAGKDERENQHTHSHLLKITKHVIMFTDEKACLRYIDEIKEPNKVFLITSGSLGEYLTPDIHHLPQIRSIYIFCQRKSIHEVWTRKYSKIKGVFNKITELCRVLETDKQQLEQERLSQIIVEPEQRYQSSNIQNSKYNNEHQSIDDMKKSIKSIIISRAQEMDIDKNLPCSRTVTPYTAHKQEMAFADTGIWPCVCVISDVRDELFYHLQCAIGIVQYFHSIESFLDHFHSHSVDPHMIIISNPTSLGCIDPLMHRRVRKLYIHCSNNRRDEYDSWSRRYPDLIAVLQYVDSLSRLVLWDLSACIVDIGNFYTDQNRKDLAQIRYDYAYRLHFTINGILNNRREIIEYNLQAKFNH